MIVSERLHQCGDVQAGLLLPLLCQLQQAVPLQL